MKTYTLLMVGLMRSIIIVMALGLVYIHWTWWMQSVNLPRFWWLYDLILVGILSVLWFSTTLAIKMNKGR